MVLPDPASAPRPTTFPTSSVHLDLAVRSVRRALGRLETLLVIALALSILGLLLAAAQAWGATAGAEVEVTVAGATWSFGYGTALAVGVGLAIAAFVLVGLVNLVVGLVAWRRGVWSLRRAPSELSGASSAQAEFALRDAQRTIWAAVGLLLAAIAVGTLFGILDTAQYILHGTFLDPALASLGVGVATGVMGVVVYFYGTRHLMGTVAPLAGGEVATRMARHQNVVLAGAILGWVASVSSLYWPLQAISVVGLAVILAGIHGFRTSYDAVLRSPRPGGAIFTVGSPS